MRLIFMPEIRSGKWAVGLGIALVVLTALSLLIAVIIKGDPTVISGNPLLLIFSNVLSVMFSLVGSLSFFVGIFTIVKHKDWSVCKSLAVLYVLAVLLFVLGEFLFPH